MKRFILGIVLGVVVASGLAQAKIQEQQDLFALTAQEIVTLKRMVMVLSKVDEKAQVRSMYGVIGSELLAKDALEQQALAAQPVQEVEPPRLDAPELVSPF